MNETSFVFMVLPDTARAKKNVEALCKNKPEVCLDGFKRNL